MENININYTKILCFGDSNTFGFNPVNFQRYDKNIRWTGVLAELGGNKFKIVEAGANNRTAFKENPAGDEFTGVKILPKYLEKDVFDVVIIAVGVNDLQMAYNSTMPDFEVGISKLVDITKKFQPNSRIILLAPSVLIENVLKSDIFSQMFDKISIEKSHKLVEIYSKIAQEKGCEFIDLNKIAKTSVDGLHYSIDGHEAIARYLYDYLS